jgi:sporulation protein YlmC with PRC-barrel domain
MKKIEQISNIQYTLANEFNIKKLIGKNVISQSGELVGKVKNIYIKDYRIIGILVKKFMNFEIFIQNEFFDSFTPEAIILKIDPVTELIGLKVFDKNGKKLGKITRILREGIKNTLIAIFVKKGIFRSEIKISLNDIQTISEFVILKKEFEDLDL